MKWEGRRFRGTLPGSAPYTPMFPTALPRGQPWAVGRGGGMGEGRADLLMVGCRIPPPGHYFGGGGGGFVNLIASEMTIVRSLLSIPGCGSES